MIRDATADDWPSIWPIMQAIVRAGETYTYPRDMSETAGHSAWLGLPGAVVLVAEDADGVLGSAKIVPNQQGPGAHVANASFIVGPAARGKGVGRALGEAALVRARALGFRAMQFNAVVEANTAAVCLWRSLGFDIIGTVPEAFDHPDAGLIGLHIMHRRL